MNTSTTRFGLRKTLGLLALGGALASVSGCGPVIIAAAAGGGGGGGGGSVSESEPNNSFSQADDLGTLSGGTSTTVTGMVDSPGGDTVDIFQYFAATQIASISFSLNPSGGGGNFSIVLQSPTGTFIQAFTGLTGTIDVGPTELINASTSFQLAIIYAGAGTETYSFTVDAQAAGPIAEVEPNNNPGEAQVLGSIQAGDMLVITGTVSPSDIFDGFELLATEATPISFSLSPAGNPDLDVLYTDGSGNLIQSFAGVQNTETGTFNVTLNETFQLVVEYFSGSVAVNYTFRINASNVIPITDGSSNEPGDVIVSQSSNLVFDLENDEQWSLETVVSRPGDGPVAAVRRPKGQRVSAERYAELPD